jgi:O-antigen/teichoic acid export membrane protein
MIDGETGTHHVKRMALRGGLAKLFGQGGNFALRLGFMVIVARLLKPEDFGLVAMVTVITAILELFASAGLSAATVQRSTISNDQISTLFWVNICVGVILCVLCVLIGPAMVAFYHEPRLLSVTAVIGVGFLFNSAGVQHLALLQRQLRYVTLAVIEFSGQLISLGFGVAVAIAGYGYWALVAAAVSLPALVTLGVWTATAWIPGRPRRNIGIGSLLHFGGTLTTNNVVAYITYNFDKFILGRVWGAGPLGYYGVASQLINIPTSNLNMALGGVLFSALSRLQDDAERFRNYFLKGYALNISMTLPITIFSVVFAEDVILVVLGPKWSSAVAVFRLLTPTVLFFAVANPVGWLLWASGRQVRSLKISLVIAVLVIAGCLIGLPYGPKGVAIGFSSAMTLWLIPHIVWCLHDTTIRPFDLLRVAGRPLLSAAVAVMAAYAVSSYLNVASPFFRLVLEGAVMMVAYAAMLLFVMGQKNFYLDLFKAMGNSSAGLGTTDLGATNLGTTDLGTTDNEGALRKDDLAQPTVATVSYSSLTRR